MPDNIIVAAARISETVWIQLKILAKREKRTMNDLIGQALTEWLTSRKAVTREEQPTAQGKKKLEEQGEFEKMKLLRKKGRPRLEERDRKWLFDKTGRKYRTPFYMPKEKAVEK
jgi:hypothetical protein